MSELNVCSSFDTFFTQDPVVFEICDHADGAPGATGQFHLSQIIRRVLEEILCRGATRFPATKKARPIGLFRNRLSPPLLSYTPSDSGALVPRQGFDRIELSGFPRWKIAKYDTGQKGARESNDYGCDCKNHPPTCNCGSGHAAADAHNHAR
jgi:hypothetical protein